MVGLVKRDEFEHWLNTIGPAERRRQVAIVLAARAALRVVPALVSAFGPAPGQRGRLHSDLVLPAFRAAALVWVAAEYPARQRDLAVAANHATEGGEAATSSAKEATGGSAEAMAVFVAAHAACLAVLANSAARAAFAVTNAMDAAIDFAADASHATDIEAGAIANETPGAQLAAWPLWPFDAPPSVLDEWERLKGMLLSANEGWEVWTEWYDARLAGDAARSPNEALEVARATIPDEIWKQGPAVVNAEIKRLIADHQSLKQRPAAFQFQIVDDKIDALPDDARPIDPETARDFYDEAKRKGQDLKDRLQRTQADENIRAHVDLLLTRLGSSYADMRPGLMLSALRSLESDVRAYEGEEGRKELSAAHLSNVIDLADSVRDLCAIFPRSREIEAEAVSLALPMQRMPEIRDAISSVVAKVNASDGATEGGRAAINASAADLAHQRSLAEEAKQSAYFLVDFANFARAGVKHLKATGRTVGGEISGLGVDGWRAIRRGAPKGIERGAALAGKALVVVGVAALMHWLGSDIAALGTMVGPYLPLHEMLEKMTGAAPSAPTQEPDASPPSSEVADNAPASRVSKPRKPKARKRGKT